MTRRCVSLLLAALLSGGGGAMSPEDVEAAAFGDDEATSLPVLDAQRNAIAGSGRALTARSSAPLTVRAYEVWDWPAVAALHGCAAALETRAELDDLTQLSATYFNDERDGFWVADGKGVTLGSVGLIHPAPHVGAIRRLGTAEGVDAPAVAMTLLRTALRHARQHGDLKVLVPADVDEAALAEAMRLEGFTLSRTHHHAGQPVRELYTNLYFEPVAKSA